jgi:hypothetical protein
MGSITAIADAIAKGNKGTDRLFIDSRPGNPGPGVIYLTLKERDHSIGGKDIILSS